MVHFAVVMKIQNLPEEVYELSRHGRAKWVDDYLRENGFPSCKFTNTSGGGYFEFSDDEYILFAL